MLNYNIKIIDNFFKKKDFKQLEEISKKLNKNENENFDIHFNEINKKTL